MDPSVSLTNNIKTVNSTVFYSSKILSFVLLLSFTLCMLIVLKQYYDVMKIFNDSLYVNSEEEKTIKYFSITNLIMLAVLGFCLLAYLIYFLSTYSSTNFSTVTRFYYGIFTIIIILGISNLIYIRLLKKHDPEKYSSVNTYMILILGGSFLMLTGVCDTINGILNSQAKKTIKQAIEKEIVSVADKNVYVEPPKQSVSLTELKLMSNTIDDDITNIKNIIKSDDIDEARKRALLSTVVRLNERNEKYTVAFKSSGEDVSGLIQPSDLQSRIDEIDKLLAPPLFTDRKVSTSTPLRSEKTELQYELTKQQELKREMMKNDKKNRENREQNKLLQEQRDNVVLNIETEKRAMSKNLDELARFRIELEKGGLEVDVLKNAIVEQEQKIELNKAQLKNYSYQLEQLDDKIQETAEYLEQLAISRNSIKDQQEDNDNKIRFREKQTDAKMAIQRKNETKTSRQEQANLKYALDELNGLEAELRKQKGSLDILLTLIKNNKADYGTETTTGEKLQMREIQSEIARLEDLTNIKRKAFDDTYPENKLLAWKK